MRTAPIALLVLTLLVGIARGEDAPAPAGQPNQTTTVEGTLPDLQGRWILVATVGLGQSPKRTLASLFEIGRREGTLEVRERHVVLPAPQDAALKRANDELGGAWAPGPSDLEAIGAAWDTLEPEDRAISDIVHQLTGRDAYDDDLKSDANTKDALWVLRQAYTFEPGKNRPVNQGNLIAPAKLEDGVYAGNYLAVAVAAAPFPIPIKFEGTFRLIPLVPGARSFWAGLGDFFAGCGRR